MGDGVEMKYQISPHVTHRNVYGEVIILDGQGDEYIGLNKSGAVIWETIAQGGSAEDAANELVSRFGIDPERSTADVDTLITDLLANGLIRVADQ